MNSRVQLTFLLLIILQATHSAEEFIFRFYERFPPIKLMFQDGPHLAKPAFAISNILLFCFGLACFYYWVRPVRKGARRIIWMWIILESFNVIAHFMWAALIRGYNPGLVTVILFVPVLVYLGYLMWRGSSKGIAEQTIEPDRP